MSKKLYVGNLLYEVTDDDLKTHFSTLGNVVSAVVIRFRDSGRSKGFGFVEMTTEEEAQKAIDSMNGQDFKGRKLVVSEARPPREKQEFAPKSSESATADEKPEEPKEEQPTEVQEGEEQPKM